MRGTRVVMTTVVGSGHGDLSSKPKRVYLHFVKHYVCCKKFESNYYSSNYGKIVGKIGSFNLGKATSLGEGKPAKLRLKMTLCGVLFE